MTLVAPRPGSTLVPPKRLADLLSVTRQRAGLTLGDLEGLADGRYSVGELQLIESGTMTIADEELRSLAKIYGIDLSALAPARAVLEIDRAEGRLIVADKHQRFQPGDDDRQIMVRYLALVYRLRDQQPGHILPARTDDLDVLAQVFGTTPNDVFAELESLMLRATPEIRSLHQAHRRRVTIPALGILVALTAMGGLLLTSRTLDSAGTVAPQPASTLRASVNIGQPLVINRDGSSPTGNVEIGDALVVTRNADGSIARNDLAR